MLINKLFDGEVALVAGGGSSIGRAAALAFASGGARVVVAGRRTNETTETVELIQAAAGEALSVKADVAKSSEVEALVGQTIARFGKLNFAFNNAGIEGDPFVPLAKYPEATWDDVIEVNLKGVFLCMKYELPHTVETKGAIVNMASVAGLVGGRLGVAYYASKHGVVGLTKAAAMEYASKSVRINAIAPAVIPTPMTERSFFHDAELTTRLTAMHPLGVSGRLTRWPTPSPGCAQRALRSSLAAHCLLMGGSRRRSASSWRLLCHEAKAGAKLRVDVSMPASTA